MESLSAPRRSRCSRRDALSTPTRCCVSLQPDAAAGVWAPRTRIQAMNKTVKILVTSGAYKGASFEGDLAEAPVTVLVPDGIISVRTSAEAETIRDSLHRHLVTTSRVTIGAANWSISAELVPAVGL
jgi:hypothetical protein